MEFQKRLYATQEDLILSQRRKEADEESGRIDSKTKSEILKRWASVK